MFPDKRSEKSKRLSEMVKERMRVKGIPYRQALTEIGFENPSFVAATSREVARGGREVTTKTVVIGNPPRPVQVMVLSDLYKRLIKRFEGDGMSPREAILSVNRDFPHLMEAHREVVLSDDGVR